MKYCLDASALVDLGERHYPERIKVFAPIWEHLYTGIDNGTVISVDYVKIELEKKAGDWRDNFLARANKMFLMDEDVESKYAALIREIEQKNEFHINKHRERFLSGADPWVLALARSVGDCTVVSSETKSLADYGLGPVCKSLGIDHINLIQFIETNNIGV